MQRPMRLSRNRPWQCIVNVLTIFFTIYNLPSQFRWPTCTRTNVLQTNVHNVIQVQIIYETFRFHILGFETSDICDSNVRSRSSAITGNPGTQRLLHRRQPRFTQIQLNLLTVNCKWDMNLLKYTPICSQLCTMWTLSLPSFIIPVEWLVQGHAVFITSEEGQAISR